MLTPSQRKKVATACGWNPKYWNPSLRYNKYQRNRLIHEIAKRLDRAPLEIRCYAKFVGLNNRFLAALSTNSTHDLESLAYELLEEK